MSGPRCRSSLSGLGIVLTLLVTKEEGHRPYLSQSAYPANGTTVGERTDDARRERTRNAPARHRARAGAGQRQRRLPRAGDFPDALLSLAPTGGTLWRRGGPSPAAARRRGATGGDPAGGGTLGARDRHQCRDLGMPPDRGLPGPHLADPPGAQHRAAAAWPGGLGHAPSAPDRARAAGGPHGRAADGPHAGERP